MSPAAPAPDRRLGRYELLGTLGTGGMATVYLGRAAGEAGFQRLFAIKVLHPYLMAEPQFIAMFLDEARIAGALHHPNIVPIVDLGTHDGTYYVAMEYIDGCSLAELLKKHRKHRPPRLLVPIMLDALAGLEAAHSLTDEAGRPINLVHRDVSPQNILIGVDGTARITDFGIARADARINTTQPGQLKGKFAYMSPEHFRSAPSIDRRADIFSAGCVLWSMLTGRRLFQAETDGATIFNVIELDIPPPSVIGLAPPAAFDAVCLRALERDPEKRFATAQDMEEALRSAANGCGLAPRREVAAWVIEVFHDELAARHQIIRAAAGASNPASLPIPRLHSAAESPSVATADLVAPVEPDPAGSRTHLEDTGPMAPAGSLPVAPAAPAAPSLRRHAAVVAGAGVVGFGAAIALWAVFHAARPTDPTTGHAGQPAPRAPLLRTREDAPASLVRPAPSPEATTPGAPASARAPSVPDVTPPPRASPEPRSVTPPPRASATQSATSPSRTGSATTHHKPVAAGRAAPAPAPAPAPPADKPPAPPLSEPSKPVTWDRDSPVPPP